MNFVILSFTLISAQDVCNVPECHIIDASNVCQCATELSTLFTSAAVQDAVTMVQHSSVCSTTAPTTFPTSTPTAIPTAFPPPAPTAYPTLSPTASPPPLPLPPQLS